jgi:hypothetical protein
MEDGNTIAEEYDALPQIVKDVLDRFSTDENDYESCGKLVDALNKIGWTCDYYLDAEPYDLRRIIKKGESYSYADLEAYSKTKGMDDRDHSLECDGDFNIGHQIVKLEHKHKDEISTFVLVGFTPSNGGIYECVYTDM